MTDAPNYNDGLWHGWNGGECPVAKGPWSVVRGEGDVVWAPKTPLRMFTGRTLSSSAWSSPPSAAPHHLPVRVPRRRAELPRNRNRRDQSRSPTATARPSQSGRKSCEQNRNGPRGLGMSALRMTIGAAIPSSKPWMMCFSTCAPAKGPSWQMANASLIAAAPDMAEALKAAIAISDRNVGTADALMNASMSMTNVLPPSPRREVKHDRPRHPLRPRAERRGCPC